MKKNSTFFLFFNSSLTDRPRARRAEPRVLAAVVGLVRVRQRGRGDEQAEAALLGRGGRGGGGLRRRRDDDERGERGGSLFFLFVIFFAGRGNCCC